MANNDLLFKAKLALRLTSNAYDAEVTDLIKAAKLDLGIAGIIDTATEDPDALVERAVITYCRANFSSPADYDRLKASYDEQKAQLQTAAGYGRTVSST